MFAKIKEAAVHTFVYGLGSVAQTLLGVILVPLYTHAFTPAEYGTLTLITLVGTLASAVFFLGAPSALARSYYDHPQGDLRRRTVTSSFAIAGAGALVQALLGAMLAAPLSTWICGSPAFAPHIRVAVAGSAVSSIVGVCLVVLRFERRSAFVVITNAAGIVLTIGLVLFLLFVRHEGLMAPLAGTLIAQSIVCGMLLWGVRGSLAPRVLREEFPLQLRFGAGAALVGLTYYALDSADRILLARFASVADVGVYSLGYKIGMLIHLVFVQPFSQIWTPMRLQYRHDADAVGLFKVMLTYYWLVGLLATVTVSLFAHELVRLAATREYGDAARVVPIVMLAHLAYGAVGVVDSGIIFSRRVSYHAYVFASALILNVGLNWWLIPIYGYMAAAWITLGSYAYVLAVVFVVSRRLYPQPVEARVLVLAASAAIVLVVGSRIQFIGELSTLVTKAAVIAALALFWYAWVLNGPERGRLSALAGRFV